MTGAGSGIGKEIAHRFGAEGGKVAVAYVNKAAAPVDVLVSIDVAEVAFLFASFKSTALTGQSPVVSHGWSMQ